MAVNDVQELGLKSVGRSRGRAGRGDGLEWPPHNRCDERRSKGAKEASNFEHTWLIYKHPNIHSVPHGEPHACPPRTLRAPRGHPKTTEYSESALLKARRTACASAELARAGHISET